jgi:uncharacterized protein (TIGR02594 family)
MRTSLPWINEAVKWIGTKEIPGVKHNNAIVRFSQVVASWVRDDETPWCAGFVGYCLKESGLPHSGSLAARSYEDYGDQVPMTFRGSIVSMHRGDPKKWQGHVGFLIDHDPVRHRVLLLGGNQGNTVSLAWFPRSRVTKYTVPFGFKANRPLNNEEVAAIKNRAAALSNPSDR